MSTSPPSSMRSAVLGVGSTFAFQLAHVGGHDATAIVRPGSTRLKQLQRDDAIVDVHGRRARVRVVDKSDEETPFERQGDPAI